MRLLARVEHPLNDTYIVTLVARRPLPSPRMTTKPQNPRQTNSQRCSVPVPLRRPLSCAGQRAAHYLYIGQRGIMHHAHVAQPLGERTRLQRRSTPCKPKPCGPSPYCKGHKQFAAASPCSCPPRPLQPMCGPAAKVVRARAMPPWPIDADGRDGRPAHTAAGNSHLWRPFGVPPATRTAPC